MSFRPLTIMYKDINVIVKYNNLLKIDKLTKK